MLGTNPKDWKVLVWLNMTLNSGDDISGVVVGIGANVLGFQEGDRVAAFHVMQSPHGSFAEYAIAPQYTTFRVPDAVSYEEASTIPLAAYTAALALFHEQQYPSPWDNAGKESIQSPLIIYGASSAVGAFAIKLAQFARIHPVIAVGSKNSGFLLPFLDFAQGDRLVDYTAYGTSDELAEAIRGAVKEAGIKDGSIYRSVDAVATPQTSKLQIFLFLPGSFFPLLSVALFYSMAWLMFSLHLEQP
jgi:NADPH2:quinone reductase